MPAPWQGLPVRLERAPHRGAAFALSNASKRARIRSIGSRSRGHCSFSDHPPPSLPPLRPPAYPGGAAFALSNASKRAGIRSIGSRSRGSFFIGSRSKGVHCSFFDHPPAVAPLGSEAKLTAAL